MREEINCKCGVRFCKWKVSEKPVARSAECGKDTAFQWLMRW